MEALHFLNIMGNGNNLGEYSENFCLAPRWENNCPTEILFFNISPLNSLNLVLVPGAKSNGHRGSWTACVSAHFLISPL